MVEMQGVNSGGDARVLVLAATNLPYNLDNAIRWGPGHSPFGFKGAGRQDWGGRARALDCMGWGTGRCLLAYSAFGPIDSAGLHMCSLPLQKQELMRAK